METKKGFLELLFLTDEQEYTILGTWWYIRSFTIYIVSTAIFIESPDVV